MSTVHTVQQGECLSAIAFRYGFRDAKAIYDHPDNAELRRKRPSPDVLFPGDRVVIPDRRTKDVGVATGKSHRLRVRSAAKLLRLRLMMHGHEPIANAPYELDVEGKTIRGSTDAKGRLEHRVQVDARDAVLRIAGRRLTLRLGALNPIFDTEDGGVSGAQARLHNLGFDAGSSDGVAGPRTRAAIMMFQAEKRLPITGEVDDDVLAALAQAYGV